MPRMFTFSKSPPAYLTTSFMKLVPYVSSEWCSNFFFEQYITHLAGSLNFVGRGKVMLEKFVGGKK